MSAPLRTLGCTAPCEFRTDAVTRQLYATDASHYEILPAAVAFPHGAQELSALIDRAIDSSLSVTLRGAGSGLAGGAIGEGVVVDVARRNQRIWDLNLDRQSVRADCGVVLDHLNAYLRPHGLVFGPDVATSSRATIGGMIANNSSGARTRRYGTTADHIIDVECVLADGRVVAFGQRLEAELARVRVIARQCETAIRERMPAGLLKRWPGYALNRCLAGPTIADVLSGSEGTLAAITSAQLKLSPLPREQGLGLIFFSSVAEAMQASVELLNLDPVAIEHIDDVLTDQTRGQREFKTARNLLQLDTRPCKSILIVEFFEDVADRLGALERTRLGSRRMIVTSPVEMNLVWALRKSGLALLTSRKGRAKPVTCIEDTAVRPEQLPDYVSALQQILVTQGLDACFYGHAASGLLHVRPVIDLHSQEGLKKFRQVTTDVAAVVRQFKGSFAAEHGIGIARTEFLRDVVGADLFAAMRQVKALFDPGDVMNPGKIIDDRRYCLDRQLRSELPQTQPDLETIAFAARDESFVANVEQCNGCGGCRKSAPTMCPTFNATGDEAMSTRGRANVIRGILNGTLSDSAEAAAVEHVLNTCLSCKACATECPSNVNLPLLKAALFAARHKAHGRPMSARLLSRVDLLGSAAAIAPSFVNTVIRSGVGRRALKRLFGITDNRPLPEYASEQFHAWFFARADRCSRATRGRVLLWDDCYARYHEPEIGKAAVKVLERAGYEVGLLRARACCGRPAFSQGNVSEARRLGTINAEALRAEASRRPFEAIVFLEPSCWSMFADDYRELGISGARDLSPQAFLFEHFIDTQLERNPGALSFSNSAEAVVIHAHCHAKALTSTSAMTKLAKRLPGRNVKMLDTGCCGMAGAFGLMEETYALSMAVAADLTRHIRALPPNAIVVASGTSCRQQVEHTTGRRPIHMAELLATASSG